MQLLRKHTHTQGFEAVSVSHRVTVSTMHNAAGLALPCRFLLPFASQSE